MTAKEAQEKEEALIAELLSLNFTRINSRIVNSFNYIVRDKLNTELHLTIHTRIFNQFVFLSERDKTTKVIECPITLFNSDVDGELSIEFIKKILKIWK